MSQFLPKSNTHRGRFVSLLIIATLIAGGLVFSGAAAAQTTKITVVLPNPSAINVYPLFAAIGEGFMAEEGLELEVEAVDGSAVVIQTLAAGRAQIGFAGPGPTINANARGVNVVFFYNFYTKSLFGLQVEEDSPYQTPADLRGKIIGVGTADGAEVSFTRSVLSDIGMAEGQDYTFLPVGDGGPAAAAILRGDVDAYAASAVDTAIMVARGLRLREITPEKFLSLFGNGFITLGSYMEENPEIIEGFGRALARGAAWANENKEKALAHAARFNPQEAEDHEFVSALFDVVMDRSAPHPQHGWGYLPPDGWERWHASVLASGELDAPLADLSVVYTNRFIDAFNRN